MLRNGGKVPQKLPSEELPEKHARHAGPEPGGLRAPTYRAGAMGVQGGWGATQRQWSAPGMRPPAPVRGGEGAGAGEP